MTDLQLTAAEAMYRAMVSHPRCTCLLAGTWPFRKQVVVEGKLVDAPDVICTSCKAMRSWESTREVLA